MKKSDTFGGATRLALATAGIEIKGRLYSDGRANGHRVKAISNKRASGKALYSIYKELTAKFPNHVVKVERYGKQTYAFGQAQGVTVHFTNKKAEA